MKKIAAVICALTTAFCISAKCSAHHISQYNILDDSIKVYCSESTSDDFSVTIAGEEAEVKDVMSVTSEGMIKTVFLIDSSGSMANYEDSIKAFLTECVDRKPSNEYWSVAMFAAGREPEYLISDDSDRYNIEKSIDKLSFGDPQTYIYDNLDSVIKQLSTDGDNCFKRIVLFTDGVENSTTGITVDEVKDDIRELTVQIHTVTLVDKEKSNYEPLKNVSALARISGGKELQIEWGSDVMPYVDTIFSDLENVRSFTVVPPASKCDRGIYRVEIQNGGESDSASLQMPGKSSSPVVEEEPAPEPEPETEPVTEVQTTVTETVTTTAEPETHAPITTTSAMITEAVKPVNKDNRKAVIICILAAVAVVSIIIAIILGRQKETPKPEPKPEPVEKTNITTGTAVKTEIIKKDSPDVKTQKIFSNNNTVSVIFRDINDPNRIFEKVIETGDEIIIGRDQNKTNLLVDYDISVSGKHCRMYFNDSGELMVENTNTSNGTILNGKKLTAPEKINSGDELKLGRVVLNVTIKKTP